LKTSVTYKEIWLIAYPIIIGSVAQNVINITDTAFLGRVGQVELGAGAIGGIFYLVSSMLAWGFGIGTQIMIARRRGERSYHEIGRTFQHGFYFMLPLTLTLFSLMKFFSGDLLYLIIKSEAVYDSLVNYMEYRSYGIFFAGVNMLFRGLYIGIARTKVITYTTILLATVNAFLDYCLIFGNFGFPEMGIGGAALASTIAEAVAAVYFTFYTLFILDGRKYGLYARTKFDNLLYQRIIKLSSPVMLQNFISMGAWLVFFLFIEKMGELPLAVSNIVRSFYVILMIPMWGFSSATSTLVSNLIGQGRQKEVMSLVTKIAKLSGLCVLLVAIAGAIFPDAALKIYTNDPEMIRASLPALYVVNFSVVFLAIGFMFFSAVSGTGKTQISFLIEFTVIVFYLVAAYILADILRQEVYIVWMCEFFYAFLLGLLSYIYLRTGRWKFSSI
jgi:putative MATE family efflux protein